MANTLLIEKQNGGYFKFTLNEDTSNAITSIQNDLLAVGNELHFKTGNGANIIKEQSIYPADVTIIAAGTFTFTTVAAVWNKLIDVGYFDWLGGGVGGVDRFDELLDTFQYTGNAGKAVIVDNSELKLVPITLYNKRLFTELEDTPSSLVPDKMVVVNPAGTALILKDQPEPPEDFLNSVGYFDYNDLITQTVPLAVVANVPKKLTNDTEGLNTSTDQNPYGVSYVWDYTTNQFNFTELEVGDTIDVRIHVQVTTTSSNQKVSMSAKFGIGSVSQFENSIYENMFKSAGTHEVSFVAPFYIGSTYITDYPAELYLTSDATATVKVDGWYVRILRKNINIITVDYQVPDATNLAKGIVRLAGDLGGNANNPTVPELANKVPTSRTVSTTSPLLGGGALSSNLTLSIQQANSVDSGFLTYADWTRFDEAHNDRIVSAAVTGTTTKTLRLNQHDGGFIETNWSDNDTAVTIGTPANGLSLLGQQLSLALADTTTTGALSGADWTRFDNKQPALIGTGFVKVSGTTISYDNSTYVPTSRTITINGTGFDLSDNRTFNVGTVTSVAALTLGTTGTDVSSSVANGTTTPVITLNIPTASATNRGALSSTDWTTFNSKQGALNGTGFVKVSGTTVSYDNSTYALDSVVVKLTGDQTITGTKTFNNTTAGVGIYSSNSSSGDGFFIANSSTGRGIALTNTSTGYGIFTSNTSTGYGIISNNTLTGVAALFNNTSSGKNLILNNTSTGTGMPFSVQKINVDVATISDAGAGVFSSTVQASAFKLTGMTAGSGALYWTSNRVTLANYNTNGVVEIEALGGSSIATFGAFIDLKKTVFCDSSLWASTVISKGTPSDSYNGGGGFGGTPTLVISVPQTTSDKRTYAFQMNTSSGLDLWHSDAAGTNSRRLTLNSSGNLGIGTTTPTLNKLQVVGSIGGTTQGTLEAFKTGALIGYSNSDTNKYTQIGYDATGNYGWVQCIQEGVAYRNLILNGNGGNVGIGTTSPAHKLEVNGNGLFGLAKIGTWSLGGGTFARFGHTSYDGGSNFGFLQSSDGNNYINGGTNYISATSTNIFETAATERMRITSGGDVFIGKSAIDYTVTGVQIENGGKSFGITTNTSTSTMFLNRRNSLTGSFIGFYYNDGLVGSISTNGTTTSYNITSDHRVKEDFKSINGLDLISKIKIYDFKFKNSDFRMGGVIAHELQEVIPYAVTGEKDAEQMQSVDYSKLVPILVQAIQELQEKINKLENK